MIDSQRGTVYAKFSTFYINSGSDRYRLAVSGLV